MALTPVSDADLADQAATILGCHFESLSLFRSAITGRENEISPQRGYDRLEFLGDRLVRAIALVMLIRELGDWNSGALFRQCEKLTSNYSLASVASSLQIGHMVRSIHTVRNGIEEDYTVLADVFEALSAAVYLDKGFAQASIDLGRLLGPSLAASLVDDPEGEIKTKLEQEGVCSSLNVRVDEVRVRHGSALAATLVTEETSFVGFGKDSNQATSFAIREALAVWMAEPFEQLKLPARVPPPLPSPYGEPNGADEYARGLLQSPSVSRWLDEFQSAPRIAEGVGHAVGSLLVAELLYRRFPNATAKTLDYYRMKMDNADIYGQLSDELGVEPSGGDSKWKLGRRVMGALALGLGIPESLYLTGRTLWPFMSSVLTWIEKFKPPPP